MKRLRLEKLIFGEGSIRRFTQDSPMLPDVWIEYGERPSQRVDLLLTPHRDVQPGKLALALKDRLKEERKKRLWKEFHPKDDVSLRDVRIAYNQSTVAAKLYFDELIRVVLPMTSWWERNVTRDAGKTLKDMLANLAKVTRDLEIMRQTSEDSGKLTYPPVLLWLFKVSGSICYEREHGADGDDVEPDDRACVEIFSKLAGGIIRIDPAFAKMVWMVARNRKAEAGLWRSTLAVKADAARQLFNISCRSMAWAVLDSGIDATHPAFLVRDDGGALPAGWPKWDYRKEKGDWSAKTRVKATYDFTEIRDYLTLVDDEDDGGAGGGAGKPAGGGAGAAKKGGKGRAAPLELDEQSRAALRDAVLSGHSVNWDMLTPHLKVPHDKSYLPPVNEHGTHVAGILAGDWRKDESKGLIDEKEDLIGVCPDLRIYDMRVLDRVTGEGDEFSVMAALQFVRFLNTHREFTSVHGVNLSLSIRHDVANYACGCTPVCEECSRLVDAGTVVVAAAGNQGYMHYLTPENTTAEGYRSISVTDPGNAEGVITVGSTHALRPHMYGVSYFSSRGPTGDGRSKPDLVAPGEKIMSPVPGKAAQVKDGTSMAAPHVSGAAALLMARHKELIGNPKRVKEILCATATDLGRERYFQGRGMVDILRALQSV